ncbi:MAG: pantoate--beta-alanine ligase [Cyclobacteriaceae bacterium]|nr:pantoate--beta-alanine ligase [Cyclobacteriaceae bacterium]
MADKAYLCTPKKTVKLQVFSEISALRSFLAPLRSPSRPIGLVPTMGALHAGHLALIAQSKQHNPLTVASIFVNPTQFNNAADLEKYPRMPEADTAMLQAAGCDVLFCPSVAEMYPVPSALTMDFGNLNRILEGEFRPGHFSGVGLVVAKLFNIVQPARAYFGQKDFQQLMVIRQLVSELCIPVEVMAVPTLREPDGLAMSSRNLRLTPAERAKAPVFYETLQYAQAAIKTKKPWSEIRQEAAMKVAATGFRLEYLALATQPNFQLTENVTDSQPKVLLIAGYAGNVRLIDNLIIE